MLPSSIRTWEILLCCRIPGTNFLVPFSFLRRNSWFLSHQRWATMDQLCPTNVRPVTIYTHGFHYADNLTVAYVDDNAFAYWQVQTIFSSRGCSICAKTWRDFHVDTCTRVSTIPLTSRCIVFKCKTSAYMLCFWKTDEIECAFRQLLSITLSRVVCWFASTSTPYSDPDGTSKICPFYGMGNS